MARVHSTMEMKNLANRLDACREYIQYIAAQLEKNHIEDTLGVIEGAASLQKASDFLQELVAGNDARYEELLDQVESLQ